MATQTSNNGGIQDENHGKTPSSKVIIVIVYMSLFLDNILLTVVVPIIPDYLYNLEHSNNNNNSSSVSGSSDRINAVNHSCSSGCPDNGSVSTTVTSSEKNYKQTKGSNNDDDDTCSCSGSEHNVNTTDNNVTEQQQHNVVVGRYIPQDIINENAEVGLLFSSKAFVQLLTNSVMGMIINRVGYVFPLICGNCCLTVSSVVFAYSTSYGWLFFARSLQGVGSSCIAVAGLGMIADRYTDDKERSKLMGIAMGGIAMGVLVGYPFGGILYDFVGKSAPFYIITAVSLMNGGSIWVSTSALAVLEPCLPIWLMDNIAPEKWQLGTVFIPDSIGYLIGTTFFGVVAYRIGRWLMALLSLLVVGISAMLVTTATQMIQLMVPHFLLGFGIGVIDSALMPMLAMIFDSRYTAQDGTVYAIAQAAVSLAYFIGPLLGSQVVKQIGFPWLMRTIGIINVAYSPLCMYLQRSTTQLEENQAIVLSSGDLVRYDVEYPQYCARHHQHYSMDKYTRFDGDHYDSD